MNKISFIALIMCLTYFGGLVIAYIKKPIVEPNQTITFLLQVNPNDEKLNSIKRLRDFHAIAIALEKYKRVHHAYPIAGENGNARVLPDGKIEENWIPGLAPTYIDKLPKDPRNDDIYEHQYKYNSNKVFYSIMAMNPNDCKEIIKLNPLLMDRYSMCNYGFRIVPPWEK